MANVVVIASRDRELPIGPPAKPTIYLIAGCNGAGKTTFATEFLRIIGVLRFLNADKIARALSPPKPEAVADPRTICKPSASSMSGPDEQRHEGKLDSLNPNCPACQA